MKKLILIPLLLMATVLTAGAQNNAYAIDDECYTYFAQAEHTVDDFESDDFEQAQQMLLETALRKKDTKAQTLYYVEQLKHTSHEAQHERRRDPFAWDSQSWNARLEQDRETVQRIAKATGYMQYYYYATELCQTYYFNTNQDVMAGEMLTGLMREARENGDDYAMWKALIYLGKLYQRTSDQISTQKYLREVVRIYETTTDPTIKRQSIVLQLCELADTYPPASDSARLFYRKAELGRKTRGDTLRVAYYNAQLAAWDNDLPEYRRNRDYCLSQVPFPTSIRGGKSCFDCMDNILAGKPASASRGSIRGLELHQQYNFLSRFASDRGQWETSSEILSKQVERLKSDIYYLDSQRLEQMSARYENDRLSADLASAAQRASRRTALVGILLGLLALVGCLFLFLKHKKPKI